MKTVDSLNIFLIIASLILAYFLPFELFLFSYAILGPLHYATEINWLDKKNYFIKSKKWIYVFFILCLVISIPHLFKLPYFVDFKNTSLISIIIGWIRYLKSTILLLCFLMAFILIYFNKATSIVTFSIISLIIALLISTFSTSKIFLSIFLPTIIHVYLFTLLFMVYGTINKKTTAGIIAIVLLIFVPLFVSLFPIKTLNYFVSNSTQNTFGATGMQNLNYYLATMLSQNNNGEFQLLSEIGLKIQIFVAFCYTYHYLNWFSKTSIIGWNKNISKSRIAIIIGIWLVSIAIYFYNYKVGLSALFFLSMLHVLYEFPLNILTIKLIIQKLFYTKSVK